MTSETKVVLVTEISESDIVRKKIKSKKTINQLIIDINTEESALYIADDERRHIHISKHPTQISCFKCMDGRVHIPSITGTPIGLVKPYRAIGGKFKVFWPALRKRFHTWVELGLDSGKRSLAFVTYHCSASNPHLGCAGWNYQTDQAKAHITNFCEKLSHVYGYALTAIPTRVETDGDIITLHNGDKEVSGANLIGLTSEKAHLQIAEVFPRMENELIEDILPFMMGNAVRVAYLRDNPRDLSGLDHHERVIALGQGFDWLARQNFALIINDIDPNLDFAIETAAKIVKGNLKSASKNDVATLFTNIPYRKPGREQREAEMASRELQEFAQDVIKERHPDLWKSGKLMFLIGVTFEPSKKLTVLDQGVVGA